jgi:pyruvate formate lyase activating enzyme
VVPHAEQRHYLDARQWEYPWYAAWDLAFHTIALSLVDFDFAKDQLLLMLRNLYSHPNGQIPAYEWNFSDVNPPVHAWATLFLYNVEKELGRAELRFLSNGIPVALARATEELRKYRRGLAAMSGGFTLSGGEPLMQDRFVVKLLAAAKEMGIHTALDTNGALGARLSDADLEHVDLVLLDLKSWEPELHRRLTGMEVGPVLDFARRLAASRIPIWVRFVLVPGFTDGTENIAPIARFSADLGNVERVDVLPFHQMGRFKWKELKLSYTLEDVQPPGVEAVEHACAQFRAVGLKAY